ncbi:MAG: hypothetical protein M9958_10565 [Chitinophagales bacterium]|nr:hypothetical protein [Chitinophagales bacterium]
MTTITLKIKEEGQEAKALLEYLKKLPFVEIEQNKDNDSIYDSTFVNKVLNAHKNDKKVTIKADKLWESI